MPFITNPIERYLKKHQIRHDRFAERLDVSRIAMHYWLMNEREPDLFNALKLNWYSNGEIKLEELIVNENNRKFMASLKESEGLL